MAAHAWLLRVSNGRIGHRLGSQRILLLRTIGRKSGKERVVPIAYFLRGDQYGIVASNWGKAQQAEWYLNLLQNPRAVLVVNGRSLTAVAHEAQDGEYDIWWRFVTTRHTPYLDYQAQTHRRIPIMVFEVESPSRAADASR